MIWKLNGKPSSKLSPNVKLVDWIPQNDLLGKFFSTLVLNYMRISDHRPKEQRIFKTKCKEVFKRQLIGSFSISVYCCGDLQCCLCSIICWQG